MTVSYVTQEMWDASQAALAAVLRVADSMPEGHHREAIRNLASGGHLGEPAATAGSGQPIKRHPEHTGLKHFEMIERNFAGASRDSGDVPTKVTQMVPAYYYEDLLEMLSAAERRITEMEAK
jgi:hypothetical protein